MMWWEQPQLEILYQPNYMTALAGELTVGFGRDEEGGLVLNHKQSAGRARSLSEYVFGAREEMVEQWRARFPGGMSAVRRIMVEDLSLDTCFGLLLFAARLEGAAPAALPGRPWVDYVTRWEDGVCSDEGDLKHSVACLLTVLGHSYLGDGLEAGAPAAAGPRLTPLAAGWRACMNLLHGTVSLSPQPSAPCFPPAAPEYARALAHCEYEYQNYLHALHHGIRCQLLVPLAGTSRRMLCDALLLEEEDTTGILKIFARHDRVNSYTRNGFALLGLHRPRLAKTGNDMVISVNPTTGLFLQPLWEALEAAENEAWGEGRPSDQPRVIISYCERDAQGEIVENHGVTVMRKNAPNQPWWDDHGRYTLVAAPKAVVVNNREVPGTKLDWTENVVPLLWDTFSPIHKGIIKEEPRQACGKTLRVVRWEKEGDLVIAESPTFQAWLATLSMRPDEPRLLNLPTPAEYEILRLPSGMMLMHHAGATLFLDWTARDFAVKKIVDVFEHVAEEVSAYTEFLNKNPITEALQAQVKLRNRACFVSDEFLKWRDRFLNSKRQLLQISTRFLSGIDAPWQQEFQQALERTWGIADLKDKTLDNLEQIDKLTGELYRHLANRRGLLLKAVVAGAGLSFLGRGLLEPIMNGLTTNLLQFHYMLLKTNTPPAQLRQLGDQLATWETGVMWVSIVLAVIGFAGYWLWGTKVEGGSE